MTVGELIDQLAEAGSGDAGDCVNGRRLDSQFSGCRIFGGDSYSGTKTGNV